MRPFVVAVCLAVGVSLSAQRSLESAPTVQIGIFAVAADGSATALALGANERVFDPFVSVLTADDCRFGAGGAYAAFNAPDDAKESWRLNGRIMNLSAKQATVQLDLRRIRAGGTPVDRPRESKQLLLARDQFVVLEPIARAAGVACDFPPVVLGARYARSPAIER